MCVDILSRIDISFAMCVIRVQNLIADIEHCKQKIKTHKKKHHERFILLTKIKVRLFIDLPGNRLASDLFLWDRLLIDFLCRCSMSPVASMSH